MRSPFFLDVLRFISAEMVVLGHLSFFFSNAYNDNLHAAHPAEFIFLAQVGVFLFFILSGFLIAQSVLKKRGSPGYGFKSYFVDRFARIYSGLIPALVLIFLLGSAHLALNQQHYVKFNGNPQALGAVALGANVLMLQDFPSSEFSAALKDFKLPVPSSLPIFGDAIPLWTLGIEWWLYMLFGWILLGSSRSWPKFLLVFALFSAVPMSVLLFGKSSLVLLWFLGAGIAFAFYKLAGQADVQGRGLAVPKAKPWFANALALFSVLFSARLLFDLVRGIDLFSDNLLPLFLVPLFGLSLALMESGAGVIGEKQAKIAGFLAGYSYTLYLVHFSVISIIFTLAPKVPLIILAALAFVAANLVSAAIAYFTEMRHRALASWLKGKFKVGVRAA